jgi:uncharacterized membrane protein YedE/YeeE
MASTGSIAPDFVLSALVGGLLSGASASLAWSGAGQIAGISGIVGRYLSRPFAPGFAGWFLAGLLTPT